MREHLVWRDVLLHRFPPEITANQYICGSKLIASDISVFT